MARPRPSLAFGSATIPYQVSVFGRLVVVVPENRDRAESVGAEEQLGGQIRLADYQADPPPPLRGGLVDQIPKHLRGDAASAIGRSHRKVEDTNPTTTFADRHG